MDMPVNIDLLVVQPSDLQRLGLISEQQIFGVGNNFHPQGLFSTVIFGAVGTEHRSRVFGVIDLHTTILHPVIFNAIVDCKAFYKAIMQGKQTALWNPKTREFEKSNDPSAQTGYDFFIQKVKELRFERNNSDKRNFYIDLIEKSFKENSYLARYILVMPAGLRDYTVTPDGKPEEDEVNSFYRRLLTQSQLVDPNLSIKSAPLYDSVRFHLQSTLNELFDYIQSLLNGKNKLVLGKWLSRKIFNSTRNVLTASVDATTHMHDHNRLRTNDVAVGLYQFLRSAAPKSLYHIKTTYTNKIFSEENSFCYLTNAKTLKKEEVLSTHVQKDYDRWMTMEGLESIIANYGNIDIRHTPITLNKERHYLGLIYNDGSYVKFFQDIDELPESFSKDHVQPITLTEYLYLSIHHLNGQLPAFVTRYPINGYGGIYPCMMQLRTTTTITQPYLLDDLWQPTTTRLTCFPIKDKPFFNGMSVHQSHLGMLGGDHDGDTMSLVAVLSDESIAEVKKTLNSKSYYLDNENKVIFSNSADVLDSVLAFLTTD